MFLGPCILTTSSPSPSSPCIHLITSRPYSGSRVAAPHAFTGPEPAFTSQPHSLVLSVTTSRHSCAPRGDKITRCPRGEGRESAEGMCRRRMKSRNPIKPLPLPTTELMPLILPWRRLTWAICRKGTRSLRSMICKLLCWYVSAFFVPVLLQYHYLYSTPLSASLPV